MTEPGIAPKATLIRAVVFDMDGVLTDSEPLINAAAIAMFKERGLTVQPEDFIPFVGTGEDRYIGGVAEKYHFPIDLPVAKARTYEIYLELVPKQLRAFPGAVELVRNCREAGLHVAVASSADRVKIEANLRQIGLPLQSWDAVVTGEEVKNKKPAPDIFLTAASKLSLTPAQCVVIEDAVNGVEAAKAAGMRCVAVAQTFPAERLQQANLVRRNLPEVSVNDLVSEPNSSKDSAQAMSSLPSIIALPEPTVQPIRPWGFWATVGLTLAILAAFVMAQTAVFVIWVTVSNRTISAADATSNGFIIALATCVTMPLVVGMVWLFAWSRVRSKTAEYLGLRMVRPKQFLLWSLGIFAMVILSDGVTRLIRRPIVPESMFDAYKTAGFLPLFWFALVVAAPLAEEILFRGFLFEGILHSRLGAKGAIFLSALSWASIHLQYDWYGIATIFVAGLFLGYVRFKTGSILVTMWLHGLMNFIATLEIALFLKFNI
jgi:HAD superfamily hydrolase (TIGR01509 family)